MLLSECSVREEGVRVRLAWLGEEEGANNELHNAGVPARRREGWPGLKQSHHYVIAFVRASQGTHMIMCGLSSPFSGPSD